MRRVGLRGRLAVALAAVAIGSVALATVLANAGISSRLEQSAEERLRDSAAHIAEVAGEVYAAEGGWTPAARRELVHLASVDGLRVKIDGRPGKGPLWATRTVVVHGRSVGRLVVAPEDPAAFREPDRDLHERLNGLHLLAGILAAILAVVAAAVVSIRLARPLRRLTEGTRRMQQGDLATRVLSGSRTRALGAQPLAQALDPAWLRLQKNLESVVLFLLEELVGAGRLVQRHAVGGVVIDAERVVVVAHQREEVVDPAPDVCLPHAQGQLLVEDLEHRQRVDRAAVDARDRDGTATATRLDRCVEHRHPVDPDGLDQLLGDRIRQQCGHRLGQLAGGCPVGLHPDRVDHAVRPASFGHLAEPLCDVVRLCDVDG
ncbi:MAG TPA: HAMP domain-containing protein, partial [Thermoleophilaceae bacterium]